MYNLFHNDELIDNFATEEAADSFAAHMIDGWLEAQEDDILQQAADEYIDCNRDDILEAARERYDEEFDIEEVE